MNKTQKEIEVRCKLMKREKVRSQILELDYRPVFSGMRGMVHETNEVFKGSEKSKKILRLRIQKFPQGKTVYTYTEKGKNESKVIREKAEKNMTLSKRQYAAKRARLMAAGPPTFLYEKRFFAEEYVVYDGVEVALFQFPHLGWFIEFELKKGTKKNLYRVMHLLGFRLKDSVLESTKAAWKKYSTLRNLPYKPEIRF